MEGTAWAGQPSLQQLICFLSLPLRSLDMGHGGDTSKGKTGSGKDHATGTEAWPEDLSLPSALVLLGHYWTHQPEWTSAVPSWCPPQSCCSTWSPAAGSSSPGPSAALWGLCGPGGRGAKTREAVHKAAARFQGSTSRLPMLILSAHMNDGTLARRGQRADS